MNAYEAAMDRLKLESVMAWALYDMWEHAEEGDFEAAMHWQIVYLHARDECHALPFSHEFYDMEYIAEYGSIKWLTSTKP